MVDFSPGENYAVFRLVHTHGSQTRLKREVFDMSFMEVATVDQIPAGQMKSFMVNGKNILLVNHEGKFYSIPGLCTHMGGELAKGTLDGVVVTCPRHGSRFDVTTGKCLSGPKIGPFRLTTKDEPVYEVRIEDNAVKVNI